MKILKLYPLLLVFLMACATGQRAFERGDYFEAVRTSVERLRDKPNHEKSASVLESAYPMALKWAQDEIDFLLSSGDQLKWEKTVAVMQKVNSLSALLRLSPVAQRIIPNPKTYTSEMNMALERAAEETYNSAMELMKQNSRDAARRAYSLFQRSEKLLPGFKDTREMMQKAKYKATLHVVVEPIPVYTAMFQLSADFFYNQVYEYLNSRFPEQGFVRFYAPEELQRYGIDNPNMILRLEFYDFVVGNQQRSESEKEVSNTVKVNTKDTLKNETITYKAKIKTFTEKVASGGVVDLKISEFPSQRLLVNDRIPGEFVWVNQYAMFVGDEKALTNEQLQLTRQKMIPPPPAQELFIEFTRPIYQQLTSRLDNFFGKFK